MTLTHFTRRLFLVVSLLVFTAHRLPAPIQEVPEGPTPTATSEVQAKSKKNSGRSKAKPAESDDAAKTPTPSSSAKSGLQGTARFAGAWTGTMGSSKVSLLFDPAATSVTMAGRARPATVNGNAISWKSGVTNGNVWTLTPNSDGKTAQVVVHDWLVGDLSATFYRDQSLQPAVKKPGP